MASPTGAIVRNKPNSGGSGFGRKCRTYTALRGFRWQLSRGKTKLIWAAVGARGTNACPPCLWAFLRNEPNSQARPGNGGACLLRRKRLAASLQTGLIAPNKTPTTKVHGREENRCSCMEIEDGIAGIPTFVVGVKQSQFDRRRAHDRQCALRGQMRSHRLASWASYPRFEDAHVVETKEQGQDALATRPHENGHGCLDGIVDGGWPA